MKLSAILFILVMQLQAFSQDKPAYKIFTGEGKKADYEDILKAATKSDVVFLVSFTITRSRIGWSWK